MKKTRYKIVSLILMMIFTLAACSGNAGTAGTGQISAQANETDDETTADAGIQTERYLSITLNGTDTVTAALAEGLAAEEFIDFLPVTFTMNEHLNRQKEVYLDFALSEENLQNPVYQYEIGDIVYWHPGPTIGIFYDHDGRDISAGVEVLARLDQDGIDVFAQAPDRVEVTIELAADSVSQTNITASEARQLIITLDHTDVLYADLVESPATEEFLTHLPLTVHMTDYVNREKHGHLDFSIQDENLQNITREYEIGDVTYYPPGPTFSVFYDHDGNIIAAGLEVIARIESGLEIFGQYPNAVDITVELAD